MNIWKILEIEETKDKEQLKNAYRKKLITVNPEDNPEGFMELRNAYEEALKLAEKDDAKDSDGDETELTKKIRAIYDDFETRIDTEVWRDLFNQDEFVALDREEQSFQELMVFLMDHVFVPRKVWTLIVEQFDIVNRRRELAERYPENFLSYIINNAQYDDIIDYYQFSGDLSDVDDYIQTYYDLDRQLRQNHFEESEKVIHQLEDFSASNSYLEYARLKLRIRKLSTEFEEKVRKLTEDEAKEITLYQMFPQELQVLYDDAKALLLDMAEDINLLHMCGDLGVALKRLDEAEAFFNQTKELYPDNYFVKAKQAEFAYISEDYKTARDAYLDLLKENHYDNNVRMGMIKANQKLIEYHQKHLEEDPDNIEDKMEIAWSYYQSYQFEKGIALLESFEPNEEKKHEYVNVKGRIYLCLMNYTKALECFELWKRYIEELPDEDTSEDCLKKKKRYEYVNFLIADCYLKMKDYDQASAHLDVALAKEHDEIILAWEAKCELEYMRGNYELCIKTCEELKDRDDKDYVAYDFLSKAFYEMNYLKESFDACQHAIALYPYVTDPYVLEIKIFCRIHQVENAYEVLKRYDSLNLHSDQIEYYRARVLDLEDKVDEALACVKLCVEKASIEETDMEHFEELYMLLGHCYDRKKQYKEAIEAYQHVLQINTEHPSVCGDLAENYKSLREYKMALEYYSMQIDRNPAPFYYLQRGIINRFLEKYKSALEDFQNTVKLDPGNFYAYSRIGLILEQHREFEQALENYDRALELIERDNSKPYGEVLSFKARCLQCMNRLNDSEDIYRKYVEELGLCADVCYDYAELLMRRGKYQDAITILRRCIDELEYDADVQACIRQLIDVYGHAGYVSLAHETMELALEKNPNDHRAYGLMADILKHYGSYEKARRHYEKAAKLDKQNDENYYSDILECFSHKWITTSMEGSVIAFKAEMIKNNMRSPRQVVKYARYARCMSRYKTAMDNVDLAITMKRCTHCFYSKCHEALLEKALLCIAMRDYELARHYLEEAIAVCGHNSYYEEYLKRIKKK